jgi:hypothetical protein|tara:strand:+ start:2667 stop:2816 length:150 start_codon:yes stop_codon:yes gene_type:complete
MDSTIDILQLLKEKIELEGKNITNEKDIDKEPKKKPKKTQKQIFEIKSQ